MKYLLFVILSLCFACNAIGQNYPDSGFTNKAEAKNLMVNGLKEGKWVEYIGLNDSITTDTSAFFYCLSIYKGGKVNGIVRCYFNHGYLNSETPYVDGKINGVQKFFYKSGKILETIDMTDGKANGMSKFYYESGKLKMVTPFINGKQGVGKGYYENGKEIKCDENGKEVK